MRDREAPLEVVLADYDAFSQSKLVAVVLQQSCFDLDLERVCQPGWLLAEPRVQSQNQAFVVLEAHESTRWALVDGGGV